MHGLTWMDNHMFFDIFDISNVQFLVVHFLFQRKQKI